MLAHLLDANDVDWLAELRSLGTTYSIPLWACDRRFLSSACTERLPRL